MARRRRRSSPQSHFSFAGEEGKQLTQVRHPKERVTGQTVAPFALRFEDVERDGDPRWGLRVAYVDRAETAESEAPAKFERIKAAVLECVKEHPGIAGAVAVVQTMGGTAAPIRAAVADLLADGQLVERKAGGRGKGKRLFVAYCAPVEEP